MNRLGFGILVVALGTTIAATALEKREVLTLNNTLLMAFGNHRVSDAIGLHTEYQFRRTGLGQD